MTLRDMPNATRITIIKDAAWAMETRPEAYAVGAGTASPEQRHYYAGLRDALRDLAGIVFPEREESARADLMSEILNDIMIVQTSRPRLRSVSA